MYNDGNQNWIEVASLTHERSGLSVCVVSGLSNAQDYTYIKHSYD